MNCSALRCLPQVWVRGVYGRATNSTGITHGGWFQSDSNGGTGVYGEGQVAGGDFNDVNSSGYAYDGYGTYKTQGNGTNVFVQNHPELVVVYAAPKGDEVAAYMRGTARLVAGQANVPLGDTFRWVTNPDIGLTGHLTPRGKGSVLFVESLTTEEMVVRSLQGFPEDVVFDYIV